MSQLPEDDRDPFEQLSRQEMEELEQFLSQQDCETVKTLDEHLQRMWISYDQSFNKTTNENSDSKI